MFTRFSQFTYGQLHIPNIDTEVINNKTALSIHIQKCEEEGLRLAMGDCLYDEFMSNLEKDENGYYKLKSDADEKWGWLLNGHSYDAPSSNCNCGCGCGSGKCSKHVWGGIISKVATVESVDVIESILAPYVYFNWNMNYRTIATGVGEAKGIANNTVIEPSRNKRVDAWNEYIQKVSFGFPNSKVSLHQFLSEHKELFPDFQKVCFNPITYWDV